MSFAGLVLAACEVDTIPKFAEKDPPPRHEITSLVQHYLDTVFVLFPIFPEATLFRAIDAVYRDEIHPASDFEHWTFNLVLGIASLELSDAPGDSYHQDALEYIGRALPYGERVLVPGHLTQVQALILLVEFAMLEPSYFDTWQMIGFAARALVDLGLHQDPPKSAETDKNILDFRRRIFWSVYSLDRYAPLLITTLLQSNCNCFQVD